MHNLIHTCQADVPAANKCEYAREQWMQLKPMGSDSEEKAPSSCPGNETVAASNCMEQSLLRSLQS